MIIKKQWLNIYFCFSFSLLIFFTIQNTVASGVANKATQISLKKPPESIANWYKPINKRQVWLHTMFRLRREMLALKDYSQTQQHEKVEQWFNVFKKDYQSLGVMVKAWQKLLERSLIEQLETAVIEKQYQQLPAILKKIENSCENCHSDYQVITRLLYRSADFNKVKVIANKTQYKISYSKAMTNLSQTVNRLKIALHDKLYSQAIDYLQPLKIQLQRLSKSCATCHYYPPEEQPKQQYDYIFKKSDQMLATIKLALQEKDHKKASITLGGFAVRICARCHAIHRTLSDLKELIE